MIEENIIYNILDKYDRYFETGPISGVVFFICLEESRCLEKTISVGKIIRQTDGNYTIRSGNDNFRIRKHLCFRKKEHADKLFSKISIDELRLIS